MPLCSFIGQMAMENTGKILVSRAGGRRAVTACCIALVSDKKNDCWFMFGLDLEAASQVADLTGVTRFERHWKI